MSPEPPLATTSTYPADALAAVKVMTPVVCTFTDAPFNAATPIVDVPVNVRACPAFIGPEDVIVEPRIVTFHEKLTLAGSEQAAPAEPIVAFPVCAPVGTLAQVPE